jgi:hypothetical protein
MSIIANKERLVRMFDGWCERGCNLDSTDFINRMWAVGQEAYPQYKDDEFNLGQLEEMIEMAEGETL